MKLKVNQISYGKGCGIFKWEFYTTFRKDILIFRLIAGLV